ncbi:hypothetical protein [Grimontia hollisae]|uniref:hypothetical protein n=1 Tax=Grimontia hollisae TaxID=673 RepID=UPI000E0633A2|nr:hypothetical protein [Grimontia hollisae]STR61862.1 Uncharacterised protein [Grimontia hollisae]
MNNLVKQNVVSGCTMMANRALLQKALPIPNEACMHDWWFALVAKTEGKLTFVDQALMLYRQHETNAIGTGDKNPLGLFKRIYRFRKKCKQQRKTSGGTVCPLSLFGEPIPFSSSAQPTGNAFASSQYLCRIVW